MAQLVELLELEDLEQVWETSEEKPTFVFKQSTTCPLSATAFEVFHDFLNKNTEDIGAYYVKVRETRPVSNKIEEELGIMHQSPQVILVRNKEAVWDASHMMIKLESIEAALKEA